MKFTDDKLQKVNEIIARYPEGKSKSALLPVLHIAQEEWRMAKRRCHGLCGIAAEIRAH